MKKLLLGGFVFLATFICSPRAHAIQFSLPYITQQSTTNTSASLVFSTAGFNSTQIMNCFQHVTAQTNTSNTQFLFVVATVTASNTLSLGATQYAVGLSSGIPYDSQWGNLGAWCGPPNSQVTLTVTGGTFVISAEQFTSKGWSP